MELKKKVDTDAMVKEFLETNEITDADRIKYVIFSNSVSNSENNSIHAENHELHHEALQSLGLSSNDACFYHSSLIEDYEFNESYIVILDIDNILVDGNDLNINYIKNLIYKLNNNKVLIRDSYDCLIGSKNEVTDILDENEVKWSYL